MCACTISIFTYNNDFIAVNVLDLQYIICFKELFLENKLRQIFHNFYDEFASFNSFREACTACIYMHTAYDDNFISNNKFNLMVTQSS